jgi:hypothetical protein
MIQYFSKLKKLIFIKNLSCFIDLNCGDYYQQVIIGEELLALTGL